MFSPRRSCSRAIANEVLAKRTEDDSDRPADGYARPRSYPPLPAAGPRCLKSFLTPHPNLT